MQISFYTIYIALLITTNLASYTMDNDNDTTFLNDKDISTLLESVGLTAAEVQDMHTRAMRQKALLATKGQEKPEERALFNAWGKGDEKTFAALLAEGVNPNKPVDLYLPLTGIVRNMVRCYNARITLKDYDRLQQLLTKCRNMGLQLLEKEADLELTRENIDLIYRGNKLFTPMKEALEELIELNKKEKASRASKKKEAE